MLKKYFVILLCFFILACKEKQLAPHTIASVNGTAISLNLVEALYDSNIIAPEFKNISATLLKEQYSDFAYYLIAQELMVQELAKNNLALSQKELEDFEQSVRKAYPDKSFEQELLEENINLEVWRKLQFYRLSSKKFISDILRTKLKISQDEVKAYYSLHKDEFKIKQHNIYTVINAQTNELAEKARQNILEKKERLLEEDIFYYEQSVNLKVVEEEIAKEVEKLQLGQATNIIKTNGIFQVIYLKEIKAAKDLDEHEVYTIIEKNIVDAKMHEAFLLWINRSMKQADIKINSVLLQDYTLPFTN